MGNLVETAIYSQWQHSVNSHNLYYARWEKGEVDMVMLDDTQKPDLVIEIKWSNRCVHDSSELKNVKAFCQNQGLALAVITTLDILTDKEIDAIKYHFIPSSLYCYVVGRNLIYSKVLKQKGKMEEAE